MNVSMYVWMYPNVPKRITPTTSTSTSLTYITFYRIYSHFQGVEIIFPIFLSTLYRRIMILFHLNTEILIKKRVRAG